MADSLDFDVLIVGAGISGINAAYRLQERCPTLSYSILENREELGGTWSLFKYPGIRSDSDLHTFGFQWRPWHEKNPIAEAASIKGYLQGSSDEYGITKNIQFKQLVTKADFSTKTSSWTVSVTDHSGAESVEKKIKARWLCMCTGYYDYKNPLKAEIPGIDSFKGQVIHPQFWPEDLKLQGKKVVIIGSGATAITLLPNIANEVASVTMLQRSPSYVLSLPQTDPLADFLKLVLPLSWVLTMQRVKFLLVTQLVYVFSRTFPSVARKLIRLQAKKQLPKDMALDPNFNPRYNVWDQRLCLCPDGDFYAAIRKNPNAKIVTDTIKTVTAKGIELNNTNQTLDADIIITATGLRLQIAGGTKLSIDGTPFDVSSKKTWKSTLLQDLPNLFLFVGYINASWTLGADAAAMVMTRVVTHAQKTGTKTATPKLSPNSNVQDRPLLELNSTYVTKALKDVPKAGDRGVWRPRNWFGADMYAAKYGDITEEIVYA